MRTGLLWILLLNVLGSSLSARILAVLPFPGKSHYIFYGAVAKVLAERGHQVVVYSPYPPKEPIANFTHFEVHSSLEKMAATWTFEDLMKFTNMKFFFGLGAMGIWAFMSDFCDEMFREKNMKALLESKEHFDLVIASSSFGQEAMVVFGHKFKAPVVTVQGYAASCFLNKASGNALSIASIPDALSFTFTNRMSFVERIQNFISVSLTLSAFYLWHLPRLDSTVRKYYLAPDLPPLADLVGIISLTLLNSMPAVEYPQPFTPNIIPVGGLTIQPDRTSLPQKIQKFMDEGKNGVIYFSFGSVVPAHQLPPNVIQMFINVFKKIPQRVLWKIEIENLPGLSENVMTSKWLPQVGVLNHPNCVLFITHGGLFSKFEAIHAGVPTLGVPFFGDQQYNVRANEHFGIGIKIDFESLSEETLINGLNTLLNSSKYKENAARVSRIFRDRPLSPAETTVFWVEYVLRHKGAHHLRSAAAQLSWYQLALLDVLAALAAALFLVCFLVWKISNLLLRSWRNATISQEKKHN